MNAFADSLFSMLFGWLRALVQGLWNAVSSGGLGGFFTWLGDHWLWVVLILVLGATVLDFVIWFIRWRPYLVWKTKMRHFFRRLRYGGRAAEQQFDQGYEEGVFPEQFVEEEMPPSYGWAPSEQQPHWMEQEAPLLQEREQPLYIPEEYAPLPREEKYVPLPKQEQISSLPLPQPRKRRSDRPARPRRSLQDLLNLDHPADEEMLDGLPPLMQKEEAFHQPVYPQRVQDEYASWHRPLPQKQEMDHQV